jgi:hypothetical protein
LRHGDSDKDGKLNREGHREMFRGQFHDQDRNSDGVITATDKKSDKKK